MSRTNEEITTNKMYTFGMPKYVYIQLGGVEKPARIEADKAEEQRNAQEVVVMKGDEIVGKFKGNAVVGWWVQSE